MNENEKRTAEKLSEQLPKLSPARRERLAQISEIAAMVLDTYDEVQREKAADTVRETGA